MRRFRFAVYLVSEVCSAVRVCDVTNITNKHKTNICKLSPRGEDYVLMNNQTDHACDLNTLR